MAYFINIKKNDKIVEVELKQKPFVKVTLKSFNNFTTICVN
jgi:hypothetical protein